MDIKEREKVIQNMGLKLEKGNQIKSESYSAKEKTWKINIELWAITETT